MFSQLPYFKVNREERHFCFLLGAEIINNMAFTNSFFKLLNSKFNLNLDPESFEIYFEVAALRDYWADLGDSILYSSETHEKRVNVLKAIFADSGLNYDDLIKNQVFWTNKPFESKLWSPGRWAVNKLKEIDSSNNLLKVRWCFNAKPDFMVLSNNELLIIEVKIESSEGRNDSGYNQYEIQKKIVHLMQLLIPYFKDYKALLASLELAPKKRTNGISWHEVLQIVQDVPFTNSFSKKSLLELKKYK